VVWWNDRSSNDDIRAERVSSDGKLLGGVGVATGGTDRAYPDVAYNSARNEYLVVWEQYNLAGGDLDIYSQRLSVPTGSGNPQLQGSPITIAHFSLTFCTRPAVAYASTSDSYLVVFMTGFWGPDRIQGRVLLSNGTLTGSVFDVSLPTSYSQEYPHLAYNRRRNEFLVVWQQKVGDYDIYARRVTASGIPLDADSFIISSLPVWEETLPTVAAIPTAPAGEYLVVWQSDHSPWTGYGGVKAQLVTGDGNLDAHAWPQLYNVGTNAISAVAGNENSRQFLMVVKLYASKDAYSYAYSSDLAVLQGGGYLDSGPGADHPAITSGPTGDFLVVFDRHPGASWDIYGQFWGNRVYLHLPLVVK